MPYSVHVEWVDEDKARRLHASRRSAALRKARETDPSRAVEDVVSTDDSVWDWVESDEALERRRFPSVPLAKAWAGRNFHRDVFGNPRVFRNEWPEDGSELDARTVLQIEYQSGQWLDLLSGELTEER